MNDPSTPPAHLEVDEHATDRNLALELVRVTEAAAMAAGRWVGRGDKFGADGAAVNAMRTLIGTVGMNGVVVIGIGGTPEGIIAACAMKCMGGMIQGKLWPKDDDERQKAIDAGRDLDRVLDTNDLVSGDDCFFVATGITDGELLRGVRYRSSIARTHPLVMRSRSGTIRSIESEHQLSKLRAYSAIDFEHAR